MRLASEATCIVTAREGRSAAILWAAGLQPPPLPRSPSTAERPSPLSGSEHFLQYRENARDRCGRKPPQTSCDPLFVDRSDLIEDDKAWPAVEATGYAEWVWMPPGGEGCDNECAEMGIELVWRHDDAGTRLAALPAAGWIEVDQQDLPSAHDGSSYHLHSFRSNLVGVGSSSRSSSVRAQSCFAASAHPARTPPDGRMRG